MNEGGQFEDSFVARLQGTGSTQPRENKHRKVFLVVALFFGLVVVGAIVFFIIANVRQNIVQNERSKEWEGIGAYLLFGDREGALDYIPDNLEPGEYAILEDGNWDYYYSQSLEKIDSFSKDISSNSEALETLNQIRDMYVLLEASKKVPSKGNSEIIEDILDGFFTNGDYYADIMYGNYVSDMKSSVGEYRASAMMNVLAKQYDILNYYLSHGCNVESISEDMMCFIDETNELVDMKQSRRESMSVATYVTNSVLSQLYTRIIDIKEHLNG